MCEWFHSNIHRPNLVMNEVNVGTVFVNCHYCHLIWKRITTTRQNKKKTTKNNDVLPSLARRQNKAYLFKGHRQYGSKRRRNTIVTRCQLEYRNSYKNNKRNFPSTNSANCFRIWHCLLCFMEIMIFIVCHYYGSSIQNISPNKFITARQ